MPNELIYHLLSQAFRAIGEAGRAAGNRRLVVVADFFQAAPLWLVWVARGEETVADVLARLREQARQQRLTAWLDGVIEQQSRWSTATGDVNESLPYRLLYIALIDLRMEAHDAKNEEAWRVAHLSTSPFPWRAWRMVTAPTPRSSPSFARMHSDSAAPPGWSAPARR